MKDRLVFFGELGEHERPVVGRHFAVLCLGNPVGNAELVQVLRAEAFFMRLSVSGAAGLRARLLGCLILSAIIAQISRQKDKILKELF